MPGMEHDQLAPFGGGALVHHWSFEPGWTAAVVVLLAGYLIAVRLGRAREPFPSWRVGSFVAGCLLLLATVSSAVASYAMSVFWVHMVEHLLLIMVVPALLVLGHPVSATRNALGHLGRDRLDRVLRSLPVAVLTHPLVAVTVYAVVIIGTHLTGFMDAMVQNAWLMTGEQVLYVASGFLLFLPLMAREPVRWEVPYLARLVLVLVSMVPDTVVGIVLLQSDHVLFPRMFAMHPGWAPQPVEDQQIAGALMWAVGDGLMMLVGVAVVVLMLLDRDRGRVLGPWLESVRGRTLADQVSRTVPGAGSVEDVTQDPDGTEALRAYNAMLASLEEHRR